MTSNRDTPPVRAKTQREERPAFISSKKASASCDEMLVAMFAEVFGPKGAAYLALEFGLRCPPEIQEHLAEVQKTVSAYRNR